MVKLSEVTVSYRTAAGEVRALDGINLRARTGEFVAVTGPSGAGKTTLLSVVAGLIAPSTGEIEVGGTRLASLSPGGRAAFRLDNIGFVFQMFRLVDYLTAAQNVEVPMYLAGLPAGASRKRALDLLDRFGLSARASHLPSRLSAGECQRVAIARALAREPKLLLADEPTGNLDTEAAAEVHRALREIHAGGCTILLATHDPHAAKRADRAIPLRGGLRGEA